MKMRFATVLIFFTFSSYAFQDYINNVTALIYTTEKIYNIQLNIDKLYRITCELKEKVSLASRILVDMYVLLENSQKENQILDKISYEVMISSYLSLYQRYCNIMRLKYEQFRLRIIAKEADLQNLISEEKNLRKLIYENPYFTPTKSIDIGDKVYIIAKSAKNIDDLIANIDAEIEVGILSNLNIVPKISNISNFFLPTAGKVKVINNQFVIHAISNTDVFALNSGVVIFSGPLLKYSTVTLIIHNQDYKSVIYGDYISTLQPGVKISAGSIIGHVSNIADPIVQVIIYYRDSKIFSTKTVDNFVEKSMK